MLYYVYIALPARLSRRVAAIAGRYESTLRSDPHITLVMPRTLARGRRERELIRALGHATAKLAPCPITYGGIGFFGEKDFVYVPVRRTAAIVSCYVACARAVRGILKRGRADAFSRPHFTLAGRLPPERGEHVWRILRRKRFAGRFRCREILLWRRSTTAPRWQLVRRFRLGNR